MNDLSDPQTKLWRAEAIRAYRSASFCAVRGHVNCIIDHTPELTRRQRTQARWDARKERRTLASSIPLAPSSTHGARL